MRPRKRNVCDSLTALKNLVSGMLSPKLGTDSRSRVCDNLNGVGVFADTVCAITWLGCAKYSSASFSFTSYAPARAASATRPRPVTVCCTRFARPGRLVESWLDMPKLDPDPVHATSALRRSTLQSILPSKDSTTKLEAADGEESRMLMGEAEVTRWKMKGRPVNARFRG